MKRFGYLMLLLLVGCLYLFSCGDAAYNTDNNEPVDTTEITPATVDILKMGKADCIVIDTGSKIIMIDTGEEENLPRIHAYMQRNSYKKIDMLILTHYDKDHIGGAADVITAYQVDNVIESKFTDNNEWYVEYHKVLADLGISPTKLTENYSFSFDSCDFEINVPKKKKYTTKQDNNSSLVISMRIGENSFLFCGDAMEERLTELIEDKYAI